MPGQPGERCGKITFVDAAETGEMPGTVDQDLIPDAAGILVNPVESFFAGTKATIQHGGDRAFYSPDRDLVQMPGFQTFRDGESCYAGRRDEDGETLRSIGRSYNVSPQTISRLTA